MAWSVPNKRPPVQEKIASAWICVLILLLCLLATSGWLLLAKMESWSTFLHSAQAIQISGIGFGVAMLALTVYLMPIEWNNAIYANWMNWRAEKMLRWQESRRKSAYLGASAILSSDTQLVDKVAGLELSSAEYVMPPLLFAERNIPPGCERFQAIYEALLIMMRSELLKTLSRSMCIFKLRHKMRLYLYLNWLRFGNEWGSQPITISVIALGWTITR